MTRAFYVGRFQPYHNGHEVVLSKIAKLVDEIIIGIGSAQTSHEIDNPFTAGERVLMLTRSLAELSCPFYVIPIEDIQRNSLWVAHVQSMSPPFDIVYSANPLVVRLFQESGVPVETPQMYERETLSGTEIRKRIISGEEWQNLVPHAVLQVIKEIDGVKRIREISRDDCGV